MTKSKRMKWGACMSAVATLAAGLALSGCGKTESPAGDGEKSPAAGGGVPAPTGKTVEIRMKGSDTMIQLATAWAEAYRKVKPNVFVNANGGGTGTGSCSHAVRPCGLPSMVSLMPPIRIRPA